ncbi:MAG: 2-amino-4-hydroxy-6-hydroxymethyldihydropteridine diphosphokinase [Algiphilus sp.]|uniref:2-amino-4-hydroxy-6- hydroxymethyldihydropteridine diphosphokinase n=1 Tax=Algiphilus sp. TaxID=1872431 RepID=UPI0032ED2006
MTAAVTAAIGFGANLGQPDKQIRHAITAVGTLPDTRLMAASALYRSAPMGPPQPDYCNAVAVIETRLAPLSLLRALQALEVQAGRNRDGERWCARELDCDLLCYGDRVEALPGLTLPHPGIAARNFVLLPLAEIAPRLEIPGLGVVATLAEACSREGLALWPDLP